ncbi:MAG: oligosaccharide flippase family protein, partial [Pyrinomonadaceae bacterium]
MFKVILTIGTIQILAILIQFIKSKIIAVYLGPAGIGIIGTIDQIVQFVAFLSVFGFPAASIKFLSKAHSEEDDSFKKSYVGFFYVLVLLSTAGMLMAVGLILLFPDYLGAELEKYQFYLVLGLLTIPTFTLNGLFINVFAASQKSGSSSAVILITAAVSLITVTIGVIYAGIFGIYVGNIIAGVLVTLAILIYLRSNLGLPLYNRKTAFIKELRNNPLILTTSLMLYCSAIT